MTPYTRARTTVIGLLVTLLSACSHKTPSVAQDPYEAYNRKAFIFNVVIDAIVYRPLAIIYTNATPPQFQTGASHVFRNLTTITGLPNDLFQGKPNYFLVDLTRFVINASLGIGGIFDVATPLGLPYHRNDFGLTLAYYSDNKEAPFFTIPFLGPSTTRDAFSMPIDALTTLPFYLQSTFVQSAAVNFQAVQYSVYGAEAASQRAALLPTDKIIAASFDPYAFVRDAYLQTRNKQIQTANTEGDYKYSREQTLRDQTNAWNTAWKAYIAEKRKQAAALQAKQTQQMETLDACYPS